MKKEILKKLIEKPISGEWGEEGDVVSVIRTTNFNNDGTLNLSDVVRRNIIEKKVVEKSLKTGDIIIEKSGGSPTQPVGRVVFFDQKGTYLCNNFTSVLRPKKEIVFPKYLHYLLFANHKFGKTERFQNKTTGIINLQLQRFIEEIQIPLPPLEAQQRIATILDEADALSKKTKQLIDSYDELAQSIFLDMFGDPVKNPKGWEKKKLGSITDVSSGSTPSRDNESYYVGNIPWIKTTELRGILINDSLEKISIEALKNTSCRLYPRGTILIAMYGQGVTRGKVGILGIEAATNQACAALPPSDKMDFNYLYNHLKYSYEELRNLGRGGNQPNLNVSIR